MKTLIMAQIIVTASCPAIKDIAGPVKEVVAFGLESPGIEFIIPDSLQHEPRLSRRERRKASRKRKF